MKPSEKSSPAFVYPGHLSKHPLYSVWRGMKERCGNPRHISFPYYGGRGIRVCDEWINSSRAFVSWGIASGWSSCMFLDRMDNDGPYSPENCRFASRLLNMRNTRRHRRRLSDGMLVSDVLRASGVSKAAFYSRIRSGWSVDDAAIIPIAVPAWLDPAGPRYFGVLLADGPFRLCLPAYGGYQLQLRGGKGDWLPVDTYQTVVSLRAYLSGVVDCRSDLASLISVLPDDPLSLSAAERRRLRSDPFGFAP